MKKECCSEVDEHGPNCSWTYWRNRAEKLAKALRSLRVGAENCLSYEDDEEHIGMDPGVVIEDITKALEDK